MVMEYLKGFLHEPGGELRLVKVNPIRKNPIIGYPYWETPKNSSIVEDLIGNRYYLVE